MTITEMIKIINSKQWDNWQYIKVQDYDLSFNIYNKPLYHKCYWCNTDAIKLIIRKSKLSNNIYEDFICENHLQNWV